MSKCAPFLVAPRAPHRSWITKGGSGGQACSEGAPGPNGADGADGADSTGPLTACTDGGNGQQPTQTGKPGGVARGGNGGAVDIGIGGNGADAYTFGGNGGRGGHGGEGGDGFGIQDGCDGGDAGMGGAGGAGGSATGGHGGLATCGYHGNAGGAEAAGGKPGQGGAGGRGGAAGLAGASGASGTNATWGSFGSLGGVWSGDVPGESWPVRCAGLTLSDVEGPGKTIQDLSSLDLVAADVGNRDRTVTASGILNVETMLYNGSVRQRHTYSGNEINTNVGAVSLEVVGAPVLRNVEDPMVYSNPVWTQESAHLEVPMALDEDTYYDWLERGHSGTSAGGVEDCDLYCIRSDWWTYKLACDEPDPEYGSFANLAAFFAYMGPDGPQPGEPCKQDRSQVYYYDQKLPINVIWYSIFQADPTAPMSSDIMDRFTDSNGRWERVSCYDQEVRYVKWRPKGENVWRYQPEDDEVTDNAGCFDETDQEHVRIYHLSSQVSLAQAHSEVANPSHEVWDLENAEQAVDGWFVGGLWDNWWDGEFMDPGEVGRRKVPYDGIITAHCWYGYC